MNFRSISFRFLAIALISFFAVSKSAATHIIGGEITYSCLGNNQYEVKLTVFRDCFNGEPYFDDTVSIGIFNYKNELIDDIRIARSNDDTIHQTLMGNCLVIPGNVCVHTSIYTDTVELKPILGGYLLVYQRCCRNKTISNIVAPTETGASFVIGITEKALLECNSSPKFKDWPPIYICANEPINYDHSAIDQDGDSIVYKLCTPINGVGMNPQPQPPYNPPYNNVVWNDPPYNLDNLLGGIPLSIDSKTGLLTGTPNTVGQFVVGICIEEYRDGELISTTTRDFQYNVGICAPTASGFFVPDINCDTLRVVIANQSISADVFFWDFGDPTTTKDVSTVYNPAYVYPVPGTYHIKLVAQAGNNVMCRDTFEKDIQVLLNTLIPNYKIKVLSCTDTLKVQLTDSSVDTAGNNILNWKYYFKVGGKLIDSSSLKNPVFSYWENVNTWEITLVVTNEMGCTRQRRNNIVFPKIIKFEFPSDTLLKCYNDTLFIPASLDTLNYTYTWTPSIYMSNPNLGKLYNTAPVSTEYLLSIKDDKSVCHLERKLFIEVPPKIEIDLPDSLEFCTKDISIPINANLPGLQIIYSDNPEFKGVIDTGYSLELKDVKGAHNYYVKVSDTFGCEVIDSIYLNGHAIYSHPPIGKILCPGESWIVPNPADPGQILISITWTPDPELTFTGNIPVTHPVGAGLHTYYVELINDFGCVLNDSVSLFLVDTTIGDFLDYQQCVGTKVFFEGLGINKNYYNWEVSTGDSTLYFSNPNFKVDFPDTGYFLVKAWIPGLDCIDTLTELIHVPKALILLDFNTDVSNCIDSLELLFSNITSGFDPSLHTFQWLLSNGITSVEDSLSLVFDSIDPNFTVSLILDQKNGCIDTITKPFYISYIPSIQDDTFNICKGEPVQLNNLNTNWLSYYWLPQLSFKDNTEPHPIVHPLVTTLYTAQLSNPAIDSFVCTSEFKVLVNVLEKPGFTLNYDSIICSKTTLININTDTSAIITWYDSSDLKDPKAVGPNWLASPDRVSNYYAIITFPNGCADTTSLTVQNQLPLINANQVFLCAGDTALLSVTNLLTQDSLVCNWNPSPGIFIDPVTGQQFVTSNTDLELVVNCTNQLGCSTTDTLAINIFNYKPPLTLTAESDTIFSNHSTQLTATNDPGYTYYWSPSTGLSSTNIYNPVATLTTTTEYKVQIINEDGCHNEAFLRIVTLNVNCEEPFSFIPNAFSPNGDGINDVFRLRGDFIKSVNLKIYNRWGEKVFETKDKNEAWDGTYKGELLGPDVYGYYLEFICEDDLHFIKKGNVSLIK